MNNESARTLRFWYVIPCGRVFLGSGISDYVVFENSPILSGSCNGAQCDLEELNHHCCVLFALYGRPRIEYGAVRRRIRTYIHFIGKPTNCRRCQNLVDKYGWLSWLYRSNFWSSRSSLGWSDLRLCFWYWLPFGCFRNITCWRIRRRIRFEKNWRTIV